MRRHEAPFAVSLCRRCEQSSPLRRGATTNAPTSTRLSILLQVEMHHSVLYGGIQRVLINAIKALVAKPVASRTARDKMSYELLARSVTLIDAYHNMLNQGALDVLEMILEAMTRVVDWLDDHLQRALEALQHVFAAIGAFFRAVGIILSDRTLPWGRMLQGAMFGAGVGAAGVGVAAAAATAGTTAAAVGAGYSLVGALGAGLAAAGAAVAAPITVPILAGAALVGAAWGLGHHIGEAQLDVEIPPFVMPPEPAPVVPADPQVQ